MIRKLNNQDGFIALVSVMVASAVGMAVAISVLLLGTGATKTSSTVDLSDQARSMANSCSEEALERIRRDSSYSGSETLNFDEGSCTFNITGLTIESEGSIRSVVRREEIILTTKDPLEVDSWQEVGDF